MSARGGNINSCKLISLDPLNDNRSNEVRASILEVEKMLSATFMVTVKGVLHEILKTLAPAMLNEDNANYYHFTGPQRFDKAIHTLEGIICGVAFDGKVNEREISVLTAWIGEYSEFANHHPFNEVIPRLHEILDDGIIDDEERADVLWLCNRFTTDNSFYSQVTSDMQRLQGILAGIIADGVISKEEVQQLDNWLGEHEHLRTCWPYDELEALLLDVMRDGLIDDNEQQCLLNFFSEFTEYRNHVAIDPKKAGETSLITGVCAVDPEIVFSDRRFCFTGRSDRFSRKAFESEVVRRGGVFSKSITRDTHYLTIGVDGNPCWAYSCYGRKVEQAMHLRKGGCAIMLVHELDMIDALENTI